MLTEQNLPETQDSTATDSFEKKQSKVGKWLSLISVLLQAVAGIFSKKN